MRTMAMVVLAALSLAANAQAPGGGKPDENAAAKKPQKKAAVKAEIKASAPDTSMPVLRKAKEPCVYKPVMTKEDMDNCK